MGVWQDFKDRVKTGFVVLLPGGASWAVWDAAGNVEVTNDGATVQDLILDGTLDNTKEFLGIPNLNDMDWEAIGTGIGNAIAAVLEASGGIIGGVGKQLVPTSSKAWKSAMTKSVKNSTVRRATSSPLSPSDSS